MTTPSQRAFEVGAITEMKVTLAGRIDRFECQAIERSERHIVMLLRVERDGNVHGLPIPAGTLSVAYFWLDRPYNLYH